MENTAAPAKHGPITRAIHEAYARGIANGYLPRQLASIQIMEPWYSELQKEQGNPEPWALGVRVHPTGSWESRGIRFHFTEGPPWAACAFPEDMELPVHGGQVAADKPFTQMIAEAAAGDVINHPQHYTSGGIEAIAVIEAWDLGFCLGNTVKYIARAGRKVGAPPLQDLRKAKWYLDREIANLEAAGLKGREADLAVPAPITTESVVSAWNIRDKDLRACLRSIEAFSRNCDAKKLDTAHDYLGAALQNVTKAAE